MLLPISDLQRFVRGAESAFKRLGVCLVEDSHTSPQMLTTMLSAALAAQTYYDFVPSEELVARSAACAIERP